MSEHLAEPAIHRALGLTDDEASDIEKILGRPANHLELAMFAVMWSEHCSYKSSRLHLGRLPSEAPHVLVGPGENAGVVDVGDGIAAAIRIESHNHPSAIEPYQGAATGVGGILRDIFTMGARPVAVMDPLRFGPIDDPRSRWIAEGVVSGVSGYGNSVGVPTIGGETVFDPTYRGNPLVNVLCLGLLPHDRLVLAKASGAGNLAVLLGNKTGRDGIGGVSVLASAGFSDDEADAEKRPSVQVGDPFEEKRLIEACLALLDAGLVVGIQDLGGAGLTCACSETAANARMGMDVFVDQIPAREPHMEPFELMTSESQERMLAIVTPSGLDEVLAICERWEVRASVIGEVTTPDAGAEGQLRIYTRAGGDLLAEVPASALHDAAPCYDRPRAAPADLADRQADDPALGPPPDDCWADLSSMLADPAWVYSQYDHQLFLNTVAGPGSDAAVLRLKHPGSGEDTGRGLALTTDGNHRWCAVDPRRGTSAVVAESLLNLACVGARPLALVNCLNFGNPEHPEVMWQLSEAIDGMAEACRAFDVPVVGGNVSLYNETQGSNIDPSPVVGLLGMVDRLDQRPPAAEIRPGSILLVGPDAASLGGSRWAFNRNARGGSLAPLDFELHRKVAEVARFCASFGRDAIGVHDVSDGGLGVAVAEMVAASGIGAQIDVDGYQALFAENASRFVVCGPGDVLDQVRRRCDEHDVPALEIGTAGGDRFVVSDLIDVPVADVVAAWKRALPDAFGAGATH